MGANDAHGDDHRDESDNKRVSNDVLVLAGGSLFNINRFMSKVLLLSIGSLLRPYSL